MACFGIRSNCQSVLSSQSRPTRVTRHFCIIKRSISAFFEKLVPKLNNYFFCQRYPHYYSSIALLNNTMVTTQPGGSSDRQDGGSTGEE